MHISMVFEPLKEIDLVSQVCSSGEWMHTSMVFEPLKEIDLVSQVCSSGEWIRTTDLRVMSENPESCH